ncbi:hypothetical protein [Actinomadura sp. 3N407]|uniref:hypothetical protein n=1 Tax=Actinomadura sp. 3N407 TaxID=3457423 RepID=UPI003FCDFE57
MGAAAPKPRPTLSHDEAVSVVAGIQELISMLPAQCVPGAVYSFLAREVGQARRATSPVKIAVGLSQDARQLRAGLEGWDGSYDRLLPALSRATGALADGVGAAADIAIANAEDPAAAERWQEMADHAAGAYDALVAASKLLNPASNPMPNNPMPNPTPHAVA